MRNRWLVCSLLAAGVAGSDCNCEDSLRLAVGQIELALCDRGTLCGCDVLLPSSASVDFGSPTPGTPARRTLRIRNLQIANRLTISSLAVTQGSDVFGITGVQRRASEAANARVESVDASRPFVLQRDEVADVLLTYAPAAAGSLTGTLSISSNSATSPSWQVALTGGGGSATTCIANGDCGDGSTIDFGTFADDEVGPDFNDPLSRPLALGSSVITLTNTGATEALVGVELTKDGIPEGPGEQPGQRGVFFVENLGCSVVGPGETLTAAVEYRPSSAGEHLGEALVTGAGSPVHIPLIGRVVGAHICFRTEDDQPQDTILQFGDPPAYATAANVIETRRAWVRNCGFQEDLVVSDLRVGAANPAFSSTAMPWSQTTPILPGNEVEVPFMFSPLTPPGSLALGTFLFYSNDLQERALLNVRGRVGELEQCVIAATPNPVDFGWVAGDEISRMMDVRLVNIGQRPCTSIDLGVVNNPTAAVFSIESNPNGAAFTLAPGGQSQPIRLLFVRDPGPTAVDHVGRLDVDSPDLVANPLGVALRARGGGSPNCDIEFAPLAAASFFCFVDSLGFGSVNYGQAHTIDLRIRNVGSETCRVSNIHPQLGTSSTFSFPTPSLTIPVNSTGVIPVTFEPRPPSGNPFEELNILCLLNAIEMTVNNGPGGADQIERIRFSGTGKKPSIDVIPGQIDFGDVTVGCCSAEQRVAIYNSGTTTLIIDSTAILGGSGSAFHIVEPPGDTTLTGGEHTEFTVRYCAASVGPASDVAEIRGHDDNSNQEYFAVPLSGTGVLTSDGEDLFQQPLRPVVDVLWVVDDSGSMIEEQDSLANNFNAFITQAVTLDTDYQIGVTNTDADTEWTGRLYACNGNPRYITSSQSQAQQETQFACNVKTSTPQDNRPNSGNTGEAALAAGRNVFEFPNLDDWNAGFYREDAKLYVVLVTDEVDQSAGPASLYVDFFRNLKGVGNPDLLNISAITGPPPKGCATAEANQKGFDAVALVGGQFRSICSPDWSDLVTSLGLDVFNARRQFPLARPATASTLEVRVCANGCPADPTTCTLVAQNASNGWTFDAAVNAITFHGTSIPGRGACVSVTYLAICFAP